MTPLGAETAESATARPDEAPVWAGRLLRLSAGVSAIVAGGLWAGPALFRPDRFSDDARQHIYWLYKYADPTLFPNDLSVEYFSSTAVSPWGYRGLYAVLAPQVDALFASKLVAIVLLLVTLWLAWLIGAAVAKRGFSTVGHHEALGGLLAVVGTAALLPQVDLLPNIGFQRTFALPITLLCVWGLVTGRYLAVGLSWMLSALIYPVLIPVLGLAASLVFAREWIRERRLPAMWHANAVLGVGAIALALLGSSSPAGIGPMVTGKQALAMAEFGPAGRQNLGLEDGIVAVFSDDRTGLGWAPHLIVAVVVAVVLAWFVGSRRAIPGAVWTLLIVGVGLWLVARWTLFALYLPNRHARYAIAAFAVVAFCAASLALISRLSSRFDPGGARIPLAVAVLAPLAVVVALLPGAVDELAEATDPNQERAMAALAQMPRDTLVAAHPDVASSVPLRTRRSVLVSTEASVAFMTGYYARLRPRIEAELRAFYAVTWDEFDAALEPYGVDVFLVTTPDIWERDYFSPFSSMTQELRTRGADQGLVLKRPPADRVLFHSGDIYVVRVGPPASS